MPATPRSLDWGHAPQRTSTHSGPPYPIAGVAVLGAMLELGPDSAAEHRAVGQYAALRADVVVAVGEAARPIADGAGERAVTPADNDAAVHWLRGRLAARDVVLVKASRGARLDEVAAALV